MNAPLHVIWDWNGTLLDDAQACINVLNRFLRERDLPLLDRERYRGCFGFPVRDFYKSLGITACDQAWQELAVSFHAYYLQETATIFSHVRQTLSWLQAEQIPQSILSACEQSLLNRQVAEHGLAGFFQHVRGTDNLDGRSKIAVGQDLMARLDVQCGTRLLIGDTLHDAEVAAALGCRCLLVANGHQDRARLEQAGCPVLDSLLALPKELGIELPGPRSSVDDERGRPRNDSDKQAG